MEKGKCINFTPNHTQEQGKKTAQKRGCTRQGNRNRRIVSTLEIIHPTARKREEWGISDLNAGCRGFPKKLHRRSFPSSLLTPKVRSGQELREGEAGQVRRTAARGARDAGCCCLLQGQKRAWRERPNAHGIDLLS